MFESIRQFVYIPPLSYGSSFSSYLSFSSVPRRGHGGRTEQGDPPRAPHLHHGVERQGGSSLFLSDATSGNQAGENTTEFRLEVFVHPRIEERVVNVGTHRGHMRGEKREQNVVLFFQRIVIFESKENYVAQDVGNSIVAVNYDRARNDVLPGERGCIW